MAFHNDFRKEKKVVYCHDFLRFWFDFPNTSLESIETENVLISITPLWQIKNSLHETQLPARTVGWFFHSTEVG